MKLRNIDHSHEPTEAVRIEGLHKTFGSNEVLKGVSLSINKGENMVVLGKSGTGKSVLIKCISGLEKADEGHIWINNEDVTTLSVKQLNAVRLNLGFLFQSGALYDSMTVRENLAFPLKRHRKELTPEEITTLIEKSLDEVGLLTAIDKMPSELSGGMRKRVGLARTLILKPAIMLYDEPTTGLDTINSRGISELILSMQKNYGITSLIITHDMLCAKYTANRVVVLKDGLVAAIGTYNELQNSEDEFVKSFFTEEL